MLEKRMRSKHGPNIVDGWEDIPDLCVPLIFLRRLMAFFNGFQNGDRWSPEAFQKLKKVLIAMLNLLASGLYHLAEQQLADSCRDGSFTVRPTSQKPNRGRRR